MARKIKQGLDYFPQWNPQRLTLKKLLSSDKKVKYNTAKSSSSAFIARKDVRKFMLKKYSNRCTYCPSMLNLEIDHIISIASFFENQTEILKLNSEENLQVLCKKCNCKKLP